MRDITSRIAVKEPVCEQKMAICRYISRARPEYYLDEYTFRASEMSSDLISGFASRPGKRLTQTLTQEPTQRRRGYPLNRITLLHD